MVLIRDIIPVKKTKEEKIKQTGQREKRPIWQVLTISLSSFLVLGSLLGPGLYGNFQFAYSKAKLFRLLGSGKYLVLFQNNTEIRSSGGFIGSFAVVDWDRGIKNIYFDTNIYKRDKTYYKENKIIPPKPISDHLGVDFWALRDANWDLDFRLASQDIQEMYQKEGGEVVDGVIVLNASIFSDLLKIIGPVKLDQYPGLELNSQNFLGEIQFKVEKDYWKEAENWQINEPKTILKDMLPVMFKQVIQHPNKGEIGQFILSKLESKDILLSTKNTQLQKTIEELNWAGAIKEASNDYLHINRSNFGGGKSSMNVKYSYYYSFEEIDGKKISHLVISKHHTGSYEWPDGINREYLRIVTPKGSELLKAQIDSADFIDQIEKEGYANYSQFGFLTTTKPGETQRIDLYYQSPNVSIEDYSLLWQKQPGAEPASISAVLNNKNLFSGLLGKDLFIQLD